MESAPELEKGINLIKKSGDLPAFQKFIADTIEGTSREAVWIDTGNESSTYALASQASQRIMEKVKIGRAFTPYQHHQSVMELEEFIDQKTEVLAFPNITSLYITDQLNQKEAEELFQETWQKIQELQHKHGLKVIVSVEEQDNSRLGFKVRMGSTNTIKIQNTSEGVNYNSETFFYRKNSFVQTTIPYWDQKTERIAKVKVSH